MVVAGKPFRPEEQPAGCAGRPQSVLRLQPKHFEKEQHHYGEALKADPAPNVGAVVPVSARVHLHRVHADLRDLMRCGGGRLMALPTPREDRGLSWDAAGARIAGGARGPGSRVSRRGHRPPAARSGREHWPQAGSLDGRGNVPEMPAYRSERPVDDDLVGWERVPSGRRKRKPSAGTLPCVERGPAGRGRPVRTGRVTMPGPAAVVAKGATGSVVAGSVETGYAAGCSAETGFAGSAGTDSDDGDSAVGTGSVAAGSARTGSV